MHALADALAAALGEPVRALRAAAGGDLNEAFAAELGDGRRVFVKTADDAAPGAFAAEAAALDWLAAADAISVPQVLAVADGRGPPSVPGPGLVGADIPDSPRFLALEWVDDGPAGPATFEQLGRGLAALHAAGAPALGGESALVLGPLTLPNGPATSWPEFDAACRLEPLARLAHDRGALPPGGLRLLALLVSGIEDLAGPAEPPARLHGDLWTGNVMTGADGRPWLIDPAAYGGHREVDLAMLRLFGSPPQRLFDAYEEVAPLAPGHDERVALWQVMPLLAHAAMFGGGWGEAAVSLVRRYVS